MPKSRSKFKRFWAETRWIIISAAWLFSLALGYYGFTLLSQETGLFLTVTERIYRTIQLIGFNSGTMEDVAPWALEVARFLLPGLTAFTALQALSTLFKEQAQWLQLWQLKDHTIVCGLGRKGSFFVEDLLKNGQKLVVIDKNIHPMVANDFRQRGAIVLVGDATEADTLLSARVTRAKNLVCLLGEDQDNLKIAHLAYQLSKENRQKLTCIIHVSSQDLLGLVKRSELTLTSTGFLFETFNIYRRAASQIIQGDPGWFKDAAPPPAHILVIGLGRLGQNLTLQAGYRWLADGQPHKLTITVLDRHASEKITNLIQRQPELAKTVDFQAQDLDLSAPKSLQHAFKALGSLSDMSRVYFCISDSILNLQLLLALREHPAFRDTPFFVRVEKTIGHADIFETPIMGLTGFEDLHLFDIHEETCTAGLVIGGSHEFLARQLRENYLRSLNTPQASALLALPWDQVPEDEKEANREQASRISRLLDSLNYRLSPLQHWDAREFRFTSSELRALAALEHRLWCDWKRSLGWKFGAHRDDQMKIHPDLRAWEDLEETEKDKNIQFIRALPQLLADMGFEIVENPHAPE